MKLRKKIIGTLMGLAFTAACVSPVFASSTKRTTVQGHTLYKYLNRGTSSATAITQYPMDGNSWISSIKYATVTITCVNGNTTKSVSKSATAVTNQVYNSTKASATASRPSSAYTITRAQSTHELTMVGATKDKDILTD